MRLMPQSSWQTDRELYQMRVTAEDLSRQRATEPIPKQDSAASEAA